MMTTLLHTFNSVEEISVFCKKVEKLDSDILVQRGKYIVDGKSIMGLLSLGTGEQVTIGCTKKDAEADQGILDFIDNL